MTRGEALARGRGALSPSPTAALDASILLAFVLGLRREALFASDELPLSSIDLERFQEAVALRATGRPVAYLTGNKEFYGRNFIVGDGVLIPRPDTELLVELALRIGGAIPAGANPAGAHAAGAEDRGFRVHESCVGSGAVVLSIAMERPRWLVSGSDISGLALEVASRNASAILPPDRPGGKVDLSRSNLLDEVDGPFDLIIANPPYVESALAQELAADWGEPLIALDGGDDGLDLIRALIPQATAKLSSGGSLLVEADGAQAEAVRRLFSEAGLIEVRSERDLGGIERVTVGRLP